MVSPSTTNGATDGDSRGIDNRYGEGVKVEEPDCLARLDRQHLKADGSGQRQKRPNIWRTNVGVQLHTAERCQCRRRPTAGTIQLMPIWRDAAFLVDATGDGNHRGLISTSQNAPLSSTTVAFVPATLLDAFKEIRESLRGVSEPATPDAPAADRDARSSCRRSAERRERRPSLAARERRTSEN